VLYGKGIGASSLRVRDEYLAWAMDGKRPLE
jgi:hypothetical protein